MVGTPSSRAETKEKLKKRERRRKEKKGIIKLSRNTFVWS
jgi:hypothetical protein